MHRGLGGAGAALTAERRIHWCCPRVAEGTTKSRSAHFTLPSGQWASGVACRGTTSPAASTSETAAALARRPLGNGIPTVTGWGEEQVLGLLSVRGSTTPGSEPID